MDSTLEPLADTLDMMSGIIESDEPRITRGLGILLLGRKFGTGTVRESYADPTDLLLRGPGPDVPRS